MIGCGGSGNTHLANSRHKASTSSGAVIDAAIVAADLVAVERDGYVILEDLITPTDCEQIAAAVTPLLNPLGRNAFEGHRTQRLYSLVAKTRVCDALIAHPGVLALLDRLLLPNYLLSQAQVINIGPGERAQLEHYDDGFYPVARPRPALSVATVWAIDAFTVGNGATTVLPGSHRWDTERRPDPDDTRTTAVMASGSCVLFLGTLWHGGGANRTDRARLGFTAQYCQPWLRTQEAFTLSTPPRIARTVSEDMRRMLGYSIHPSFIGAVDGMHPQRLLDNT
ncbi:phytanoyl-CoA dioxygenase family protein [Nocardia fluminea]|uniref:phytanoyl-CoA dioxygenase family protein n=1 Tax=Nocardia fluminea TaxID=134984 RepID=UPI003D13D7BF